MFILHPVFSNLLQQLKMTKTGMPACYIACIIGQCFCEYHRDKQQWQVAGSRERADGSRATAGGGWGPDEDRGFEVRRGMEK